MKMCVCVCVCVSVCVCVCVLITAQYNASTNTNARAYLSLCRHQLLQLMIPAPLHPLHNRSRDLVGRALERTISCSAAA